ncbi:hypothetical protein GQ473_05510 [archaeon]|nr:hypothetical protein [archaeon]
MTKTDISLALNSKYIPLVQKPSCCNVTCLQMILYRRGFGLFDQQELAKFFKINVGKDEVKSFNIKLDVYVATNNDEGLKTIDSEKIINQFFKEKNINLNAKAFIYSKISNLKEFLIENIKNNNDLWLEYKTHKIHGDKLIHDNVIESVKTISGKTKITLVDPYWEYKPRLDISIEDLEESISDKFGRETGFIVISKK